MQIPSEIDSEFISVHARLLLYSYCNVTGLESPVSTASDDPDSLAAALFFASFALVSHTTAPDPVFNFGNRTALTLFEMPWQKFTCLPSRFSAEPENRETRAALLRQVSEKGFIDNYSGIRISATGKRFRIHEAVVWNLRDAQGVYHGQAALFRRWSYL